MTDASASRCVACGELVPRRALEVPDHEYGLSYVARFVDCERCRSSYQDPMPASEELASFYPATYHSMGRRGFLTKVRNEMRLRRLRSIAPETGPILDHGCGDGAFLVFAASRMPGRKLYGFEIDSTHKVETLADGAVTIVRGSQGDLLEVLPPCALITMNHVIEHLPDPLGTVSALFAKLQPGGLFEGQTPAASSLEHRVFGPRWSGYHAPRHTVVFSRRGLRSLLERAGFGQIQIRGAFNPAGIAISLATLRQKAGEPGTIVRSGFSWLFWLGLAAWLAPIDLLSGSSGIIDFAARRSES